MTPRMLLAAPASGGGKTTVTCALLQALVNRGIRPAAFKCGPDYIDPLFHTAVTGVPARSLDLFLMGEGAVRRSLAAHAGDLAVIEGAMGYYDGIAMGGQAGAYDLARRTNTPAVLVVDGRGMALSAAALVRGFAQFRPDSGIRGVIFNRISPMLYPRLRDCVEGETGIRAYGFLPPCPGASLESRHLGLVTAAEVADLRAKLELLGRQGAETLDVDGLLALAASAPELDAPADPPPAPVEGRPRIAIARDRAFCFYYEDALELLEELGAELAPFSPLEDRALPPGCSGLYLGGGYPELYAKALAGNAPLRSAVRAAVAGGMPTVAECGGFLYLHDSLEDAAGQVWPMAGVFPGTVRNQGKLGRFGYVTLTAAHDGLLCGAGESLPAHEFHYWDSPDPGGAFHAQKPQSDRGWDCGRHTPTLSAGFPHLHFRGCPQAARRFVAACASYQKERLLCP